MGKITISTSVLAVLLIAAIAVSGVVSAGVTMMLASPQELVGPQGPAGADGATWLSGVGAPDSNLGIDGDYYLDTDNNDVYNKASDSWTVITNLKGAKGDPGDQGPPGPAGVYAVTSSLSIEDTTSTSFVTMPDMSVDVTVDVPSLLLITFSTQVTFSASSGESRIRALVDGSHANPMSDYFVLASDTSRRQVSFTFYQYVDAGTHTVRIEWRVTNAVLTARVLERTLTVLAHPA